MTTMFYHCVRVLWGFGFVVIHVFIGTVYGGGDQCSGWSGSRYFDGICYKLINSQMSWDQAQTHCAQEINGGYLAEGTTEARLAFMREMVMFDTSLVNVWIGGRFDNSEYSWVMDESEIPDSAWDINGLAGTGAVAECVEINNAGGWRMLASAQCGLTDHMSMCQKSTLDPCAERGRGGEYFEYRCFTYVRNFASFHDAQAYCENNNLGDLAELWTQEYYEFIRSFAYRNIYSRVVVPAYVEVELTDGQLVYLQWQRLSFSVRACQEAYVRLWDDADSTEFYRLVLGGQSNKLVQMEHHSSSYIGGVYVLASLMLNSLSVLSCEEARAFDVKWYHHSKLELEVTTKEYRLEFDFSYHGMSMISINRAALSMGAFTGEWVLGDRETQTYIGGSDEAEEGVFRWVSNDLEVSNNWWNYGEPNDQYGEDHLVLKGLGVGLNDANGGDWVDGFICEQNVLAFSHILVLPEITSTSASADTFSRLIHVTSASSDDVIVEWTFVSTDSQTGWMGSFEGRDESLEIAVPSSWSLGSSGVYTRYVLLKSTRDMTVVLSVGSANTAILFSLLIPRALGLRDRIDYFILTSAGIFSGTDQLIITSLFEQNDISIVLSRSCSEHLQIVQDGVTYRYPVSGHLTLDRYQTLVLQCEFDLTGTMVSATSGVVVLAGTKVDKMSSTDSDSSMDTAIPIDYLGTEYLTFPSLPLDQLAGDAFLVLAVYDGTLISIPGQSSIWLQSSGDSKTVTLPRYGFHRMTSDFPFYARKVGWLEPSGLCQTTLLPPNLWMDEYVFRISSVNQVVLFIVEAPSFAVSLNGDSIDITELECMDITETTKMGCLLRFGELGNHSLFSSTGTSFPAYLYRLENTAVACHPLGINLALPVQSSEVFDPEEFLDSHLCFHNTSTTIPTTTATITTTATTETSATTTTDTLDVTTTTAATIDTTTNQTVSQDEEAFTLSQAEEAARKIQGELTVSYRNTSSFKRSKTCASDSRVTSAAIGASGIFAVVSLCGFVWLSDVINFMQVDKKKPQKKNSP